MASTSHELTDPHCSSSFSSTLWDVFLSFAGKDTRKNFISHLYKALNQRGIETFMDDPELRKGEEISSGLLKAIHGSKMFVVVISEKYASSSWCLNELIEILDCKRTKGQMVIPVFCYVDPSVVRFQKGSFGEALERQKDRQPLDMVEKWISALSEIAEISGYHLKKDTDEKESDTIHEIVENVARQTSTDSLYIEGHLFGIDSAVEEIYQKLRMDSTEVRAIGIWGMGGIGKTTTAKAFYNKYSNKFSISCFIEDIKQYSQGCSTLLSLLEQLLIALHRKKDFKVADVESGVRLLKKILCSNKALIVLDDLDQSSYWKLLIRLCDFFSAGSRIIITTRDEKLINQLQVDIPQIDIYKLKELDEIESLKLFSYHAFRKTVPAKSFREFSLSFVEYAGGLPLALKVLGSSLCGMPHVSFWKAQLKKVRQIPDKDLHKILRLSYDGLSDEMEKTIFLDIVFFFLGKDKDEAIHVFDSCDFFPDVGIPILVQRCLLTVDDNNKFQMHNLIQQMGREVICDESRHGLCRRLYLDGENAWESLQSLEGTHEIEGLILDLSKSTKRQVSAKIFEKLPKLRLLHIIDAQNINGNFKNMFHELRCIRWHYCPWTHLPSSFHPHKLISLDMPFSKLETLWKGATSHVNLKIINLSYSKNLKKTPNFRNAKFVEKLVFLGCIRLLSVHPTIVELSNLGHLDLGECNHLIELPEEIGELTELGHLDLRDCVKLKRLPDHIKQLTNMSSLNVARCHNLNRLPEHLGDIKGLKELDASYTAIEQLPDSIVQLKELVRLNLYSCKKLKKLPEQFGNLESLERFRAGDSALEELPDSFVCLINLVQLDLGECKELKNLPDGIWRLKLLKVIHLNYCSKLERLPDQLGKLQCLEWLIASSTAIKELPDSIGLLSKLKLLNLDSCKRLTYLPNSFGNLTSLTALGLSNTNTVKNMKLEGLALSDIRLCLPMILTFSCLKYLSLSNDCQTFSSTKPFSLSKLLSLETLECKNFGSSLLEFPVNLKELSINDKATLELPDLSSHEQLHTLDIQNCNSLQSLPKLPPHLTSLTVSGCTSLQNLPDLSFLRKLTHLRVTECSNLRSVSLKQSYLQVSFSLPRPLPFCHRLCIHSSFPLVEYEYYFIFGAIIPNREIAEWFSYKGRGCTVSFDFPPNFGESFALALWAVFKIKNTHEADCFIGAVITNKTEGISQYYRIYTCTEIAGVVQSVVVSTRVGEFSAKAGDRIDVSFHSSLYSTSGVVGEVNVEKCGAHVMQKMSSTPS